MAGYLTTHVLDTASGQPAADLAIDLWRIENRERVRVASVVTNRDGRTDTPILPEADFRIGVYELVFHAGAYLERGGVDAGTPAFLDEIPIRFGMAADDHYHVPLLLSPYSYATYRGS
jgi:5-hydroxyisourate hydrolase